MTARRSRSGGARLPYDGELFFKLVRVVNLTARPFVETLARRHKLSLNEWRVMIVLASHPGSAAHEIADVTGLDKMSVSRAIAALGRHDRISRRPDPQDARRTLVELNAACRRIYQSIGISGREREAQLFAGIGADDKAELERLIDRLVAAVETPR